MSKTLILLSASILAIQLGASAQAQTTKHYWSAPHGFIVVDDLGSVKKTSAFTIDSQDESKITLLKCNGDFSIDIFNSEQNMQGQLQDFLISQCENTKVAPVADFSELSTNTTLKFHKNNPKADLTPLYANDMKILASNDNSKNYFDTKEAFNSLNEEILARLRGTSNAIDRIEVVVRSRMKNSLLDEVLNSLKNEMQNSKSQ